MKIYTAQQTVWPCVLIRRWTTAAVDVIWRVMNVYGIMYDDKLTLKIFDNSCRVNIIFISLYLAAWVGWSVAITYSLESPELVPGSVLKRRKRPHLCLPIISSFPFFVNLFVIVSWNHTNTVVWCPMNTVYTVYRLISPRYRLFPRCTLEVSFRRSASFCQEKQ